MVAKAKLKRFAEINTFTNVFELDEAKHLKGLWASQHFVNSHPIFLELACGKGEYVVNMALRSKHKNFIGVDYKGNRLWCGAKKCLEEGLSNATFLRIQIENVLDYFAQEEVAEIWITFPDPQLQKSRERKRLTAPAFLDKYKTILKPGGFIHLKTDSLDLYRYTCHCINELGLKTHVKIEDLYRSNLHDEVLLIKTYYEKKYLSQGKAIYYLKFSFA